MVLLSWTSRGCQHDVCRQHAVYGLPTAQHKLLGIMRGPAATLLLLAVAAAGLRPSRAARAVRLLAAWQHSQVPAGLGNAPCGCRG